MKWTIVERKDLKDNIPTLYRWVVKNLEGVIIAGYVGETIKPNNRHYMESRDYRNTKYSNDYDTDTRISTRIREAKEAGNKIEFQVLNINPEVIKEKKDRLELERKMIIEFIRIKSCPDIWNKLC